MKTMMILASAAMVFAGGDPQMGTWKLNEAKSKLNPEAVKLTTAVYAPAGDRVKITVDGADKDGKPVHDQWTGRFDGKDYPVTGDPRSDMRSYRQIDDRTLEVTVKKAGNVVAGGFIVISADGRSRSVIAMTSDPNGKKVPFVAVYDKQ
jgi:hypothetical protein